MAISSTTYRITAVLKVETEILARPIIRAMILVTMYLYVKNFKTNVIVKVEVKNISVITTVIVNFNMFPLISQCDTLDISVILLLSTNWL
jgi:hypothetical protein